MDYIENVSGTDITINDSNGDKIVDYDLVGRLEQDSTSISGGDEYDSPSPDFPQEINVVTGNIGVKQYGKNLLKTSLDIMQTRNTSGTWNENVYTLNGVTFTINTDLSVTIGGTFSTRTVLFLSSGYNSFQPGKYLSNGSPQIASGVTSGITCDYMEGTTYITSYTNRSPNDTEIDISNSVLPRLNFYIAINSSNEIGKTFYPMLRLLGTDNTYEPHQEKNYNIILTKNKADYSMFKNNYIQSNGKPSTVQTMGEMYSYFIKVKPSTTYTFSIQETTSTYDNWFGVGEYKQSNDTSSSFIRRDTMTTTTQNYITFTTHAEANYVRLSARNLLNATKIQFEEGNQVTTYQPYLELGALGDHQDYIIRSSGKNLFNGVFRQGARYTDSLTETNRLFCDSNIWLDQGKTYTMSTNINTSVYRYAININDNKFPISRSDVLEYDSGWKTQSSFTFTASVSGYLGVPVSKINDGDLTTNNIANVNWQIEEGEQATRYEPYGKDKWYLHKEIGKEVYNGSESWQLDTTTKVAGIMINDALKIDNVTTITSGYCDRYVAGSLTTARANNNQFAFFYNGTNNFWLNVQGMSLSDFKTWLLSNNTLVYYILTTPTTTEITDETLLSQLNNMRNMKLLYGLNYIQTTGDLPPTLSLDYYTWDRRISPDDRQALIDNTATIPYRINIIKDGNIIKTLDEHSIVNINYEDFRYVDSDSLIVGQFVARKVTGTLDQIYTDFEIEDTEIELQMGVSYNNTTTYYSLGNFLVTKPTTDDVKDKTTFEALDYTKKFNQKFDATDLTFPCTALDLAKYVCEQCGVELGDDRFTNNDFVILNNQYTEGESCRKVMQDIGKLAYSWVRIDWNNKCYIDFEVDNTINDKNIIPSNKYYTLDKQEFVYGPINRVVVGMKDVEGENVILEDAESISQNGANELRVYDNNLTYTPELRNQVIEAASKLFGLAYTPLETTTVGHPWLLGNERIKLTDNDENETYTYAFDRTIEYQGHIKTKLASKGDTKTETEYKNTGGLETDVRKTRIIVDKNTGDITSLTSRTNTISDQLTNTYTIQEVNELVQNAETGVTNTFSTSGGNNIFRNTGLWFETNDNNNPYEFWSGVANWTSDNRAVNLRAIVLKNTTFSQQQSVPNGTYTISFKYEKNIVLANVKVVINDIEYTLSNNDFSQTIQVTSQSIKLDFVCDVDDACIVYDLMVNSGDVRLAYTQNQNETTTDTVNISKGITITSSSSDVTFKANADGIRTIDRNNTELTTFTDKGMKTKEAEITGKSQIVGILFQEVGDQTWLTKL